MILIAGSITAKHDTFAPLRAMAIEHSRRSRAEPGCLAHNVHADCETPLRLVFVEKWQDMAAVKTHFAVKASLDFVAEARKLAAEPPQIEIYDTTRLPFG